MHLSVYSVPQAVPTNSMERIPSELLRSHILLCLRVKEFLRFRLVSRAMFKAVTKACIPLLTEDEEVMPRATMINVSSCMFCERRGRMEQKAVPYDSYPRRLFTYCNRVDCFTKMLASLMKLAEEENRILLYDTSHEKYHLDCPRSAGGTTPATCDRTWKWADNKVRAEWAHYYENNAGACYYTKDVELLPFGTSSFLNKVLSFY